MVYSLKYRRPSYRKSQDTLSLGATGKSIDESASYDSSRISGGIPEALSFDRIVSGGTCPPCTIREFVNYLKYIELSAENLQFFLWLQDYTKRFSQLPANEKALSPEWREHIDEALATAPVLDSENDFDTSKNAQSRLEANSELQMKPTVLEKENPFNTPPISAQGGAVKRSENNASLAKHVKEFEKAFNEGGVKLQPFTIQPFREEISRIISIYIADGGTRQLNLSSRERATLLRALEYTTHPSAFQDVQATVEWTLRQQAHPNFIRWTICNGNRPRVVFARGLGVVTIVISLIAIILITLSSVTRAWRVLPFIGFFIGISTLVAAWKGMCVVLHGMHHRHVRPWELFEDESDNASFEKSMEMSVESLGYSNGYEDEPWVAKYEKRNLIRKVFDREVWVKEQALRQIQDTIFLQAILAAFILSAVTVGIFCALPHGNCY